MPIPSATTMRRPSEAALRAALAKLTDRQRAIVQLFFYEGLSQGAIARRLGITQQVVQKTLHGAPRNGRIVGGALPRLRRALATGCGS